MQRRNDNSSLRALFLFYVFFWKEPYLIAYFTFPPSFGIAFLAQYYDSATSSQIQLITFIAVIIEERLGYDTPVRPQQTLVQLLKILRQRFSFVILDQFDDTFEKARFTEIVQIRALHVALEYSNMFHRSLRSEKKL